MAPGAVHQFGNSLKVSVNQLQFNMDLLQMVSTASAEVDNFLSPREALFAVWALVVLLAGVDPVVAVQLVGAGEAPAAARPGAEVGLVADVRAEVRAQVRRLLVLARALGVVALVQRAPVRVPVGVLAADAPALLALALLACCMLVEFEHES